LIEQSVRTAMRDDLATYDMLSPGDAYKLDWDHGVSPRGRAVAKIYLKHGLHKLKAAASRTTQLVCRLAAHQSAPTQDEPSTRP
jgi:hypothetical protein